MAVRVGDGTYRIRRRTPGYRSGVLVLRLGVRDRKVAARWEQLALDAYQEAQYGILDALVRREIWFPEALKLRDQGGWAAIKAKLEEKQAAPGIAERDAEALLGQFVEINPRGVREKTLRTTEAHARAFIEWLKERHDVESVDVAQLFNADNLRAFRKHLIDSRHAAEVRRLEEEWRRMDDAAPPPAEREQIREALRGAKGATANRYVNSIGAFSSWLVEKGVLQKNPAVGVRQTTRKENPHRERTYRYFEAGHLRTFLEFSRLYDQLHPAPPGKPRPDTLFWRYLVGTGATTQNEGTRFRLRHLDFAREQNGTIPCYIHGTKSEHRQRWVPIPIELANDLVARGREFGADLDSPLFPFSHDEYLSVWRGVMRLIAKAKPEGWKEIVTHSPYDLRHTYAVHAVEAGISLPQLQKLMGHSSLNTTMMYARSATPVEVAIREAAKKLGI